ncbi:MAG: phage tail protein [Fimbriimonadaceae bacterium]
MNPFLGEIRTVGFNFAPNGWALCDGQLLSIAQNTALFSLLGTFYGGDGISTFALPNLQGSVAVNAGTGAGLSPYSTGEVGGTTAVTLAENQMPSHVHGIGAVTSATNAVSPVGNVPGVSTRPTFAPLPSANLHYLNDGAIVQEGSGQSHNNLQPTLVVNFIIALQGIFPSRG